MGAAHHHHPVKRQWRALDSLVARQQLGMGDQQLGIPIGQHVIDLARRIGDVDRDHDGPEPAEREPEDRAQARRTR